MTTQTQAIRITRSAVTIAPAVGTSGPYLRVWHTLTDGTSRMIGTLNLRGTRFSIIAGGSHVDDAVDLDEAVRILIAHVNRADDSIVFALGSGYLRTQYR